MIKVDWTILLQAANFFILLGAMHLILYRPLGRVVQRRRDELDGNLQQAEALEGRLEERLATYQQQMQQAKTELASERKAFRQDLAGKEAALLSAANEQAASELQSIRDRVAKEKEQALVDLKNQAEPLAAQISQKVLGRAL